MPDIKSMGVSAQIAAMPTLPIKELWALWDAHFPRRPEHTNRNYVQARLAYRIQELAYGALPSGVRNHLAACGAKHSKIKTPERNGRGSEIHLMPGSTLVREWDDREYRVSLFHEDQPRRADQAVNIYPAQDQKERCAPCPCAS